MKKLILLIAISWWALLVANGQNTWKGTVDNNWFNAQNWSLGHAPVAAENVVLPANYINYPSLPSSPSVSIGALDIWGKFYINKSSLTISKLTTHPGAEIHASSSFEQNYVQGFLISNGFGANLTSTLQNTTIYGAVSFTADHGTLTEGNNIYTANAGEQSNIWFQSRYDPAAKLMLGNAGPSRYDGNLWINLLNSGTCSVRNFSVAGNFIFSAADMSMIEIAGNPNAVTVAGTVYINIKHTYGDTPRRPTISITDFSNGATASPENISISAVSNILFANNKLNIHKADIADLIGSDASFTNNTFNTDTFNIADNSNNTGNWMLQGNTFKGHFSFTKNGNGRAYAYSNRFNGTLAITQNGSGNFTTSGNIVSGSAVIKMPGNGTLSPPGDYDLNNYGPDQFAGDLTLTASNTGHIGLSGTGIGGDLKLYGNNTSVNNIVFNGNGDSHLYSDHGPVAFSALTIAKTAETGKLILDVPVNLFSTGGFLIPLAKVNFTKGQIISSKTAPFTFLGRNIIPPVASAASHVVGPVIKTDEPYIDNTTSFTFPVGSDAKYYPLTISGEQISAGDQFTAEYISQNPTAAGYDVTKMATTLKGVATTGYWLISRDAGTTNVTATFTFNAAPGTITNLGKLRVAHWNGSLWEDLGNGAAAWIDSANGIGRITTAAPITSFSPFAIATTNAAANVLPVTFTTLSAIYKNGHIEVSWVTAGETNCAYYDIEVSTDGTKFTKAGTVTSKAPGGNAAADLEYNFSFTPAAMALSGLILLPFFFAFSNKKRPVFIPALMIIICVMIGFAACRKEKEMLPTGAMRLFIRIAQVDKDGAVHYSKIIKAVE
ncbi:hypothetical protein [Niabella drilacis]|uniref:Uncharacterized protein n=1 Tax=Niabella drilacis (strain DSM 25811 / CCM 8410 / CCUG 62505 / LMG 26954 / E90) TaxID=1285928 RepID=A0A1G6TES1_NIADE|nr:hypothetical protein [Niabella drilacis]SDD27578.1 hypothetical protein SAMN04487894_107191 [Niabella drilacis]